jgi:hypothetical protein
MDLPDAKTRKEKGILAKSLPAGIVLRVVAPLVVSAGAYLRFDSEPEVSPALGPHHVGHMRAVGPRLRGCGPHRRIRFLLFLRN